MNPQPVVKIRWFKVPGKPVPVLWYVTCDTCVEGGGFLAMLHPFVRAHSWADAVWWANWHAAEHVRCQCNCCGHRPSIPNVTPLDRDTAKVDDRLFLRTPNGWQEVAA